MRSSYCGLVDASFLNKEVLLYGWVQRRRDHGGVIFIDLRDREGIVQVVCDPDTPNAFKIADSVRNEYVIKVEGKVRRRPEGTINEDLVSGEIEVLVGVIEIINQSETPPFMIDDESVSEAVRLKYRYLDLRQPFMQENLRFRHTVTSAIRNYLDAANFIEIETPMLTKSTPEGARDYLVPSRVHPNYFYALPQSPQIFKQLLMVSGFDRYYQIAKCFRDEDLRSDRQPEFTQIDIETSFLAMEEIMELMEEMIRSIFRKVLLVDLPKPFPIMSYSEAMARFGSDKPDLRIPLELVELKDLMMDVDFKVFRDAAVQEKGRVAGLCIPGGSQLTRKQIDEYTQFVSDFGAKGLAYIKVEDVKAGTKGLVSPIVKFLSEDVLVKVLERLSVKDGDLIFFGADKSAIVNESLGALRNRIGIDLKLVKDEWAPLWINDFPLFEYNEDDRRWYSLHHPFTSPIENHENLIDSNPGAVISKAYDMVLNGSEIGGGSIRIHNSKIQEKVFRALKIGVEEAQEKFGFLLKALSYGAPPHGGIAFGLDRIVTLMKKSDSIREVIAFPKTQRAQDLMMDAPNEVDKKQLKDLSIRLEKSN